VGQNTVNTRGVGGAAGFLGGRQTLIDIFDKYNPDCHKGNDDDLLCTQGYDFFSKLEGAPLEALHASDPDAYWEAYTKFVASKKEEPKGKVVTQNTWRPTKKVVATVTDNKIMLARAALKKSQLTPYLKGTKDVDELNLNEKMVKNLEPILELVLEIGREKPASSGGGGGDGYTNKEITEKAEEGIALLKKVKKYGWKNKHYSKWKEEKLDTTGKVSASTEQKETMGDLNYVLADLLKDPYVKSQILKKMRIKGGGRRTRKRRRKRRQKNTQKKRKIKRKNTKKRRRKRGTRRY